MRRLRLSHLAVAAFAALVVAVLPFVRDAAGHEAAAEWHWESEGTFDDSRVVDEYHWDVQTDVDDFGFGGVGTAQIEYGRSNAFWSYCFSLYVEGAQFVDSTYGLDFDDRGLTTSSVVVDDLSIVRKLWVPPTGMDFIRYIDVLTNDSAFDGTYTVEYRCSLGTILVAAAPDNFSSDGDATYEAGDSWVGGDNPDDTAPAVAFVVGSDAAPATVTSFSRNAAAHDAAWWSYEVDIAAGETVELMVFGVQAEDEATATTTAEALAELPDEALDHAGGDIDLIKNWVFDPPGAPVVRTNGPYDVDEGESVTLGATVVDLEGDPLAYAWDLDADGAFDDAFVLDPEVSAAGLDGPRNLTVSLWASDGTLEVVRSTTVRVRNVAPTITSDPGESATTAELYSYQATSTDPAGALDPIDWNVIGPPGMVVNAAGRVTWTPDETEAYQASWAIELVADDSDGGQDTQEWVIDLGGAPHVTPTAEFDVDEGGEVTLSIDVTDSEGDEITASWDLDRDGDFADGDGTEAVFSAAGVDGPDDTFARVSVSDGTWNVVERVDVHVRNAPPIFDVEPEREARTGALWTWALVAHDPGGDDFDFEVDEDQLPPDMVWDPKILTLSWPVNPGHLEGSPWSFEVSAEDDEGDRNRKEVSVAIIENYPPDPPRPVYPTIDSPAFVLRPTLKVGNGTDLDGDPLTYFFELDTDPGFRSIALVASGEWPEGPGVTEWIVPRDLVNGSSYYWRTWVNDGIDDSEKVVSVFSVTVGDADAGPPDDDGGGTEEGTGCACRTSGSGGSYGKAAGGAGWTAFGALVLVAARRRRSSV